MLKKRLIGVVVVKKGWAVQSFGYSRYLPLGKPECVVENLDRWGADEILVLSIDRSINGLAPDFSLIEKLSSLGLETPFIYGGGIRMVSDGIKAVQLGADRVCVDSLLHDNLSLVYQLAQELGQQAIIGVMPVSYSNNIIEWFDYRKKSSLLLTEQHLDKCANVISEVLVVDWVNEGRNNGFDMKIINNFHSTSIPLIPFGGLSEGTVIDELLSYKIISAVAVGNFLNYKEHSIQTYKKEHDEEYIRNPHYKEKYTLLNHK
jgi:imidazole glycerol-phosphate synthase subunit HisF